MEVSDELLRYPIGKFIPQENYTETEIQNLIHRIEILPGKVEAAIKDLTATQLDTPYRPGGWTIRQVVHHLADSHMNAYIRLKWTLTEETPTIKAYDEKAWATTPETNADPIISLNLLKSLHIKWVLLFKSLSPEDLKRQFYHPDAKKYVRMDTLIGTYAWHGEHHLSHIRSKF